MATPKSKNENVEDVMTRLPEMTVIRDTREQKGWIFDKEEKKPGKIRCNGTVNRVLDAGDYSLVGYENIVRIERKFGFAELFGNFFPKPQWERFTREMEKLRPIKYKYLLIESSLNSDVWCLSVPQYKFGGPPVGKVFEGIVRLQQEYGIIPIFAGDCGQKCARKIFEQVIKNENPDAK